MTHRKSEGMFDISSASAARQKRAQRAADRAADRRRKADLRRQKRAQRMADRQRKRQEARWHKAELHRRRAEDKRLRKQRRKWARDQKRQTLGGSWGHSRNNPAALRTARNLLTLASQIGVRFTKDDQQALIDYAEQEMATSGDDLYSIYERLTHLTFIGRRVLSVVGQYAPEDIGDNDTSTPGDNMVVAKVQAVSEMLGQWQATRSVRDATALGVVITTVLGATPEDIKADQRNMERNLTEIAYNRMLEKYAGKSRLWQTVHFILHPEDRPENARALALDSVDAVIRENDASEARSQEALDASGESVSVQEDNPLRRLVLGVRGALGL